MPSLGFINFLKVIILIAVTFLLMGICGNTLISCKDLKCKYVSFLSFSIFITLLVFEFSLFSITEIVENKTLVNTYKISDSEIAKNNTNIINQSNDKEFYLPLENADGKVEYFKVDNNNKDIGTSDTGYSYVKVFKLENKEVLKDNLSPIKMFIIKLINGFNLENKLCTYNERSYYEIYLNY